MRRMISIVDLATGWVSELPSDTPTFDVPRDFALETAVAALDYRSHAHYSSTRGKNVSCEVFARPLSWRVRGEECLVSIGTRVTTPSHPASYKLCAIEPNRQ
jgi:hypothetical protein